MQVGHSVKLDFMLMNNIKLVAKQNDINSRYINIALCEKRKDKELPNNATITLNITRCDGQKNSYLCDIVDNVAIVYLSSWAVELSGILTCDVSVIENNERLTTMPFLVEVVPACCTTEDIQDADSEDIITNLCSRIDELENRITIETVTIKQDDWELDINDNKYKCIIDKDTVTDNTYIIANELSNILNYADVQSNNGSYTLTASELPTEAVNLLLIFLKGDD